MRLDKFIANNSGYSRSQAKVLIRKGEVSVVGREKITADTEVSETDTITLNGQALSTEREQYWMINKPKGFICARKDANRPTVFDLIEIPFKEKLQIVGRLDKDTTGILLLTTDGQWNHQVTHPNKTVNKTYLVTLEKPVSTTMIEQLENGIYLSKEQYTTKPARVELTQDTNIIRLVISEGKYHQVKRMMIAVGNFVENLHREKIGDLSLDQRLAPGELRPLSRDEIKACLHE